MGVVAVFGDDRGPVGAPLGFDEALEDLPVGQSIGLAEGGLEVADPVPHRAPGVAMLVVGLGVPVGAVDIGQLLPGEIARGYANPRCGREIADVHQSGDAHALAALPIRPWCVINRTCVRLITKLSLVRVCRMSRRQQYDGLVTGLGAIVTEGGQQRDERTQLMRRNKLASMAAVAIAMTAFAACSDDDDGGGDDGGDPVTTDLVTDDTAAMITTAGS